MAADKDPAAASWHLDRRVPIALIASIFFQTVCVVWWASSVNSDIAAGKATSVILSERLSVVERDNRQIGDRITRLEVLLETQAELLKEIRDTVKAK